MFIGSGARWRPVVGPYTKLGIVFQNPVLLDWRNVLDNVLVQLELRGLKPDGWRDRAMGLLGKVGLGGLPRRMPRELSGGMRQRAAIVRALIHDPPLLMMDEPFGALDALTREQMRIDLEKLWLDRRQTTIFITHGISEAVALADRVVVMTPRPGRIDRILDIDLPRPRDKAVVRAALRRALRRDHRKFHAPRRHSGIDRRSQRMLQPTLHRRRSPRRFLPDARRIGEIDWATLERYMDWIAARGRPAIAMNMDASEVIALTEEEQFEVVRVCQRAIDGRVPFLSGVVAGSTRGAAPRLRSSARAGARDSRSFRRSRPSAARRCRKR